MTEIGVDTDDSEVRKGPGHVVIKLREDKKWQTILEDNCLRFYFNTNEQVKQETSIIEEIVEKGTGHFVPVTLGGTDTVVLAKLLMSHERSLISEELYVDLIEGRQLPFYQIDGKFMTGHDGKDRPSEIIGRTIINIKIGNKTTDHNFLIVKGAEHQAYLANDVLHRYHSFLDLQNNKFWSRCGGNPKAFWDNAQALQANQMTPYAVEMIADRETEIPANTRQVKLHLVIKSGQVIRDCDEAIIVLNDDISQSGLSTQYVPIVTTKENKCQILIDNTTSNSIVIQKDTPVAMAIDDRHYADDLTNLIVGRIPGMGPQEDGSIINETVSYPRGIFRVRSIHPYEKSADTEVSYSIESGFIIFKMTHYDTNNEPNSGESQVVRNTCSIETNLSQKIEQRYEVDVPEVFPGFTKMMEEQVKLADACKTDQERQELRQLLIKFKELFSKDSYDCGVTDIHEVRIPTDETLPPVYQRQYRLPLASIEDIAEIIKNLEQRKIIRQAT